MDKLEAEAKIAQEIQEKEKQDKEKEKSDHEKQMEMILMNLPKSSSMQLPSTVPGKQSK